MSANPKPDPTPPHPAIVIDKNGVSRVDIDVNNGEPATFNVDFTGHPENYCEIKLISVFKRKEDKGRPGGTVGVGGP